MKARENVKTLQAKTMKYFYPLKEECENGSLQCIVGREWEQSLYKPWILKLRAP